MATTHKATHVARGITHTGGGGPALAISREWRLLFVSSAHATQAYMEDIEFRDTVNGPDLATTTNVTASSNASGFEAAKAADSNTLNHWNSHTGQTYPHWFQVTLVAPTSIREVALTSADMEAPVIQIQYFDVDSVWKTVATISPPATASWPQDEQRVFTVQ